jgi:hypothetical protein
LLKFAQISTSSPHNPPVNVVLRVSLCHKTAGTWTEVDLCEIVVAHIVHVNSVLEMEFSVTH